MRDIPLSWPCRVTREPDGRYVVTPFAALQCARIGTTLEAASESAKAALSGHIAKELCAGCHIEPPSTGHIRPEDLKVGRVIRVLVEDRV